MMFCGVEEISEPVANGQSPDIVPVVQRMPFHHSLGNETLWLHARTAISATHSAPLRGSGVFFIRYPGFRHCVAPPWANSCRPPGSNIVCEHQLADFVHTQCGFRPAKRDFVRAKPGYRSSCPAHALPPFIGKRNTLAPCKNRDFCHPLSSASGFGCFFGFATAWLHLGLTAAALRAQNHSEQRKLRSFAEAP